MKIHLGLALLLISLSVPSFSEPVSRVFPKVEAETLDGKSQDLPAGFGAQKTWIVLGFTKDSQKATSLCLDLLEKDFKGEGYGAALLQGIPFFIKGTVKKAIRNSVPEIRKSRYLFLFEGKQALKEISQFDPQHEDEAYVLGLQDSKVFWTSHGTCDPNHYLTLKSLIQAFKASK